MRFFHNSADANLAHGLRAESEKPRPANKPRGFWFDADGDWLRWLNGEGYLDDDRWNRPHWYEVEIPADVRLLTISTAKALRAFGARHKVHLARSMPDRFSIDWSVIAKKYDGVLITPYQWSCRLDDATFWYYGWDCASGCIWRGADRLVIRAVTLDDVCRVAAIEREGAA